MLAQLLTINAGGVAELESYNRSVVAEGGADADALRRLSTIADAVADEVAGNARAVAAVRATLFCSAARGDALRHAAYMCRALVRLLVRLGMHWARRAWCVRVA
jgi:hypothetical protein